MMEISKHEVQNLLHTYLDTMETDDRQKDAQPIHYVLQEDSIRREEHAWHGQVILSRAPRRWAYVHEDIAIILQEIREKAKVNIFLEALEPTETSNKNLVAA
jgi:hypothetical protein